MSRFGNLIIQSFHRERGARVIKYGGVQNYKLERIYCKFRPSKYLYVWSGECGEEQMMMEGWVSAGAPGVVMGVNT